MHKLDYLFQRLKVKVTRKFETSGILRSGISAIAKPHLRHVVISTHDDRMSSSVEDNRNSKR